MEPQEKFKFYFQELKEIYEGHIRFVLAMSTSILLSIGWFITSESARDFVGKNVCVKYASVIAAILTAMVEFYITIRVKDKFIKVSKLVSESAALIGFSEDHYDYRVIRSGTIYIMYCFHLLLLILLCVLLMQCTVACCHNLG